MIRSPKASNSGLNSPFVMIPSGILVTILGLYEMYVRGVIPEVLFMLAIGFVLIGWGLIDLVHRRDDEW